MRKDKRGNRKKRSKRGAVMAKGITGQDRVGNAEEEKGEPTHYVWSVEIWDKT
jgi:hypothetical protein